MSSSIAPMGYMADAILALEALNRKVRHETPPSSISEWGPPGAVSLRDDLTRAIDEVIRHMCVAPSWFERDADGKRVHPRDVDDPPYRQHEIPPVPERYMSRAWVASLDNHALDHQNRITRGWANSTGEVNDWWGAAEIALDETLNRADRGIW